MSQIDGFYATSRKQIALDCSTSRQITESHVRPSNSYDKIDGLGGCKFREKRCYKIPGKFRHLPFMLHHRTYVSGTPTGACAMKQRVCVISGNGRARSTFITAALNIVCA
jgi:hypothetical protein